MLSPSKDLEGDYVDVPLGSIITLNDGRSLAFPGNFTAIARCMAPASVMVTAGIKQSGKIITAVLMKCSL